MRPQYIKFSGKHPESKKDERQYSQRPHKNWNSYGASYSSDFLKLDIDDFNHNTGEIEEPIKGKPRSDSIIAMLDSLGVRYNGIATEHGKHLFFRLPEGMEQKNKINWFSPLGVRMEWKFPASDDHIPLKINGVERQFFKGSVTNVKIDELPPFLYPLQRYKGKPFMLDFPEGDRTQKLGAYVFYLVKKGYTADQAFQIVRLMNEYVFEKPIPANTLEAEILNDSTLKKLQEAEKISQRKEVSPETFKRFLSDMGMFIQYNELLNIVEFLNIPNEPEFQDIRDVQNQMPTALQYAFRKYIGLKNISKQQTIDLISLEADKNSYNPVKDYLQGVIWDGKDRFPELFQILGVQSSFEQSLIRKWFYQSAALPFNKLESVTIQSPLQSYRKAAKIEREKQ